MPRPIRAARHAWGGAAVPGRPGRRPPREREEQGGATAVMTLVFRADFLDGAAATVTRLVFEHWVLAALLAGSPLLAALLVGYGYMQRAIRRRAARAARAAEAAATRPQVPGAATPGGHS